MSEEEKIPAVEMEKNSIPAVEMEMEKIPAVEGKEQHEIDPEAKKSCNDKEIKEPMDAEYPTIQGGQCAVISKKSCNHGGTDLPSDAVQLKKKKEKKRKRSELQGIKEEEQLSVAEKTEVLVEPHMPDGAEDAHLLAVPEEGNASRNTQMNKKESRRKRRKLQEIKKEEQLSGAEKTHVPLDAKEPWRWHATFSTVLKRKNSKKLHKGFILLRGNVKRIVLIDTDGTKLDAKFLKEGETVYPGASFEFACHRADVGEPILEDEAIFSPIEQGKKRDLKRKRLKRIPHHMTSPQAALMRSSIGRLSRVCSKNTPRRLVAHLEVKKKCRLMRMQKLTMR